MIHSISISLVALIVLLGCGRVTSPDGSEYPPQKFEITLDSEFVGVSMGPRSNYYYAVVQLAFTMSNLSGRTIYLQTTCDGYWLSASLIRVNQDSMFPPYEEASGGDCHGSGPGAPLTYPPPDSDDAPYHSFLFFQTTQGHPFTAQDSAALIGKMALRFVITTDRPDNGVGVGVDTIPVEQRTSNPFTIVFSR